MEKIVVYHPATSHINGGSTFFYGECVEAHRLEDGSLMIKGWETATEKGHAYFAAGQWAYVCMSIHIKPPV
jgi:hypothetical protein